MTGEQGWQVPTGAPSQLPWGSMPPPPPRTRRSRSALVAVGLLVGGLLGGLAGAGVAVAVLSGRGSVEEPADLEALVDDEVAEEVERSFDRGFDRALDDRMEDIAAEVNVMLSAPPAVTHLTEMVDLDGVPVDLPVGACFGALEGSPEALDSAVVVPCEDDHVFEVYALPELEDGAFPGDARFEEADEACYDAFERAIGVPYEESPLEFTTLPPSAGRWREGDRTVTCVVHGVDAEPVSRSALGQGA